MDPKLFALLLCIGLVRGTYYYGGGGGGMGLLGYGGGLGFGGGLGGFGGGLYGGGGMYGYGGSGMAMGGWPSMYGYYGGPVWGQSGNAIVGGSTALAGGGGTAISIGGTGVTGPGVGNMYATDIGADTYIGSTMSAGGSMFYPSVGYGFGGGMGGFGSGYGLGGAGFGMGGAGFGMGGYGMGMGGFGMGMGMGFRPRCFPVRGKFCPWGTFFVGRCGGKKMKCVICCRRCHPKYPCY